MFPEYAIAIVNILGWHLQQGGTADEAVGAAVHRLRGFSAAEIRSYVPFAQAGIACTAQLQFLSTTFPGDALLVALGAFPAPAINVRIRVAFEWSTGPRVGDRTWRTEAIDFPWTFSIGGALDVLRGQARRRANRYNWTLTGSYAFVGTTIFPSSF